MSANIKYHINHFGETKECEAKKECPFVQGKLHHDNENSARAHYEQEMHWLTSSPAFAPIEWGELTLDQQIFASLPYLPKNQRTPMFFTTEAGQIALERARKNTPQALSLKGAVWEKPTVVEEPSLFNELRINGFASVDYNYNEVGAFTKDQETTQQILLTRASVAWSQRLTNEEIATVHWMTVDGTSVVHEYVEKGSISEGYTKEDIEQYMAEFDSAMSKAPSTGENPISVFRGDHAEKVYEQVDRVFSASADFSTAHGFSDEMDPSLRQFSVNKIATPTAFGEFSYVEAEVFVPYGTYRVSDTYDAEFVYDDVVTGEDPFTEEIPVQRYVRVEN